LIILYFFKYICEIIFIFLIFDDQKNIIMIGTIFDTY